MRHLLDTSEEKALASENMSHLTNRQLQNLVLLSKRERQVITCLLMLLGVFMLLDFFEDNASGIEWARVIVDITFGGLIFATLLYLWKNIPFSTKKYNSLLNQEIVKKHKDSESWKAKSGQLIAGLTVAIEIQLEDWCLTTAEKEVALFLLKGYSLKDISLLRSTGERTVRQQASSVYSKAGLANRAELSAFFLEDFLLPVKMKDNNAISFS